MMVKDIVVPSLMAFLMVAIPAAAQAPAAAISSAAQADRGAATFRQTCALCHGEDMAGGAGTPSLTGPEFKFGWAGKPVGALFAYVRDKMPPGQSGALSEQQYLDVVAAILRKNGVTMGLTELDTAADDLKTPVQIP